MLTSKAKYALRALIFLARREDTNPVLIADMAREEKLPKKFLERILLELKAKGILQSRKGKGGGYFLGRDPSRISIGEVVRLMDGPLAPVPCVSQTAYTRCKECTEEKTCCIRIVMKDVRDAIASILDGTTLADMIRRGDSAAGRRNDVLTYEI